MIQFDKLMEAIYNATTIANSSLVDGHNDIMQTYFDQNKQDGSYTAKTVSLNYPVKTKDNTIETARVEVPLITVVPISATRIDELRFTTNLEISLDADELLVSFCSEEEADGKGLFAKKRKSSFAKVELVLKPTEGTEGLRSIIEGYEKVLRAQIPG
ncbi:DUF2589 domain-containing protein [Rurimicrobium arvi]|uniref:DUF2589 domain-containing protein n=1 Tax=Rurimicrobium arvi TaxID=2049916 RepID=A0ABP8N0U0_9BACT